MKNEDSVDDDTLPAYRYESLLDWKPTQPAQVLDLDQHGLADCAIAAVGTDASHILFGESFWESFWTTFGPQRPEGDGATCERVREIVDSTAFQVGSHAGLFSTFVLLTMVSCDVCARTDSGVQTVLVILVLLLVLEVGFRLLAVYPNVLSFCISQPRYSLDVFLVGMFCILVILQVAGVNLGAFPFVVLACRLVHYILLWRELAPPRGIVDACLSTLASWVVLCFVLVWTMVTYSFGAIATVEFSQNDPRHWSSLFDAWYSLLRITTNSGSSSFMSTTLRGCDVSPIENAQLEECRHPDANPFWGSITLVVYQIMTRYVLLGVLVIYLLRSLRHRLNKSELGTTTEVEVHDQFYHVDPVEEKHKHGEILSLIDKVDRKLEHQDRMITQVRNSNQH